MPTQPSYWKVLTRRKILKNEAAEETKLNRVLGVFDLTALGVGSTLGAGVYVLAGQIAKDQAGPSVMLSFAIAALASALAGVCYAEFGARVPKAGSAYIYSYVCIGEFVAFIVGWNLILEYVIGTAGVCRSISLYLDTLLNDTLKTSFADLAPMQWNFLGGYFDFLAFALAVIFGVTTAFGVETSTILNNVCTLLNISVLLFVIIAGSMKADISNWQVDPLANLTESDYNIGKGGYFPFGFKGTLKGAATCFFGFVGFDCIATTGEEVRNPQQNIPRSILYSLLIIFLCYFGVSTVLTLMVPYYIQDPNAPLPFAFKEVGWNFAMWVVTIGGMIGLLASLFGALFPIPRIMYSMADDGLLFRFLGKVSSRFKTPVTGSIIAAFLTGIMAGAFDLAQLVNLLSIGTLLAYTVVAISVTILRFMNTDSEAANSNRTDCHTTENSMLTSNGTKIAFKTIFYHVFNFQRISTPNSLSTKIVGSLIIFFCIISLSSGLLIMNASEAIMNYEPWALGLLSIFVLLIAILLTAIWMQPKELYTPIFRVPLVPLVPAISIFINIYLMLQLDIMTWIRFGLWMVIGLPIFVICYYSTDKSKPHVNNRRESFMGSLQRLNVICNDQLKVLENGVCNSSVKMLISQPKEENQQTRNEERNNNSELNEIMSVSIFVESQKEYAVGNNDFLRETYSNVLKREQRKTDPCTVTIMEEENSVIAMLDDILQLEDNDTTSTDCHQQISIDSEITPYCVKTTTAALIHNNCEPNLSEPNKINQTNNMLYTNDILYMEVSQLALNLVDEILKSDELVLTVQAKKKCNEHVHESIQNWMSDLERSSHNSEPSDLSQYSLDENILHSDNFKNKLNILMAQPPLINRFKKKVNKPSLITELKPSKNKADMTTMEKIPITENMNDLKKEPQDIPKPPKFDPVLYSTVGTISQKSIRTRPGIEKLREDMLYETPIGKPLEEVPFKAKLEAILKRGPSNRMQKQGAFTTSQKLLSMDKIRSSGKLVQNELQPIVIQKTSSLRSTTRLKSSSSNVEIINDIRKKLRHVNVDKQK